MKKITLLLLLGITAVQAQNFEWLQTPDINFNLSTEGISYPLATDSSGNVYMAGFKENPSPYIDIMGTVFYNKYDHDGNLLYSRTLGGEVTVYEMATDSEGNLLMAAGYTDAILFENVGLISESQGVNFLMIKFSPDGDLIWYRPIETQGGFMSDFRTIVVDSDDNIYIGYDDYYYSYIEKLNTAGVTELLITQAYAKMVTSISVDNAGNIYAAGACAESNATYAGVPAGTTLTYNTYAAKYSPTGVFQWIKYVEDITCPFPQIKARTPDEVYFSSHLFGSYAFGPITVEGPVDNSDFFLAKLNSAGDYQWVREVTGTGGVVTGKKNFLELDGAGNVYFAGGTRGTVNWGNGVTTINGDYNDDAVLVKYDTNGNALMAVMAGGDLYDRSDSVRIAADGSVFLSGMANGDAVFGDLTHDADPFQNYPYLTKISSAPLGIPEQGKVKLSLYPNPASDKLHFTADAPLSGTIWNMIGQQMQEFSIGAGAALDVSKLAQGSYIVKVDGTGGSTLRFVKH